MKITYDVEAQTVGVEGVEPITVKNVEEALDVIRIAATEMAGEGVSGVDSEAAAMDQEFYRGRGRGDVEGAGIG